MSDLRGIGPPDYCWHHGHEPVPDDCYIVCGECGHAWTREALEAKDAEVAGVRRRAELVFACPLCAHDF